MKKGYVDIISDGNRTVYNEMPGCLKRCGGIGDILTGTLGTFNYWCHNNAKNFEQKTNEQEVTQPTLIAAYAASAFVKDCSKRAYKKFHRSLLAVDIIEEISETFYELYE